MLLYITLPFQVGNKAPSTNDSLDFKLKFACIAFYYVCYRGQNQVDWEAGGYD